MDTNSGVVPVVEHEEYDSRSITICYVPGDLPSSIVFDPVVEATVALRAARQLWNISEKEDLKRQMVALVELGQEKVKMPRRCPLIDGETAKTGMEQAMHQLAIFHGFHDISLNAIDELCTVASDRVNKLCTHFAIMEETRRNGEPLAKSSIRFLLQKNGFNDLESVRTFYDQMYRNQFEKVKVQCTKLIDGSEDMVKSDEEEEAEHRNIEVVQEYSDQMADLCREGVENRETDDESDEDKETQSDDGESEEKEEEERDRDIGREQEENRETNDASDEDEETQSDEGESEEREEEKRDSKIGREQEENREADDVSDEGEDTQSDEGESEERDRDIDKEREDNRESDDESDEDEDTQSDEGESEERDRDNGREGVENRETDDESDEDEETQSDVGESEERDRDNGREGVENRETDNESDEDEETQSDEGESEEREDEERDSKIDREQEETWRGKLINPAGGDGIRVEVNFTTGRKRTSTAPVAAVDATKKLKQQTGLTDASRLASPTRTRRSPQK